MTKRRPILITVLLGVAAVAVGGCTSTKTAGNGGVADPGAAGSSATSAASVPSSPSASVSPAAQVSSSVAMPECRDADLTVGSAHGGAASGHVALLVTFTDRSGHQCYLQGFPKVSLADASGRVLLQAQGTLNGFIGAAVANGGAGLTAPPYVVLDPGRTVMAVLEWEDVDPIQGVPGGCRVPQSADVLVTAPGSTLVAKLPGVRDVCDAFRIGPVTNRSPS